MIELKMLTEKEMMEIRNEMYEKARQIEKYLNENRLFADVYVGTEHNQICVEICWGDWKHDHLRTDWLIREKFNPMTDYTETTEEDGSDCYSAIHNYFFN